MQKNPDGKIHSSPNFPIPKTYACQKIGEVGGREPLPKKKTLAHTYTFLPPYLISTTSLTSIFSFDCKRALLLVQMASKRDGKKQKLFSSQGKFWMARASQGIVDCCSALLGTRHTLHLSITSDDF